jgi:hypothetical protein
MTHASHNKPAPLAIASTTAAQTNLGSAPQPAKSPRPTARHRAIPIPTAGSPQLRRQWAQSWNRYRPLFFKLKLPELPRVVGYVEVCEWEHPIGWSVDWFVRIDRKVPLPEHMGWIGWHDAVNAGKRAVEDVMLSMLSGHGKIALARRLQRARRARR